MRESVKQWRLQLEALLPGYWSAWDQRAKDIFTEHEQECLAPKVLRSMRNYVDQGPTRRPDGLTLQNLMELHEAEAAIRHELDTKWARLEERRGCIELAEMFSFHFLLRDRQKEAFKSAWHNPAPAVVYLLLDFKQHDTLPVGPRGP